MKFSSRMFLGIAIAAIFFSAVNYREISQRNEGSQTAKEKIAPLFQAHPEPIHLGKRTKEDSCEIQGALPDPECTPGQTFPLMTKEQICVKGYTQTVRNVPISLKKKVYEEYGIAYPKPRGAYEADHFIPLELGGSNDIANLFPEAAAPSPGFHEKDLVENYLHQEVCAGRIDLVAAQEQIANDWVSVYNALAPEQIKGLQNKFNY